MSGTESRFRQKIRVLEKVSGAKIGNEHFPELDAVPEPGRKMSPCKREQAERPFSSRY